MRGLGAVAALAAAGALALHPVVDCLVDPPGPGAWGLVWERLEQRCLAAAAKGPGYLTGGGAIEACQTEALEAVADAWDAAHPEGAATTDGAERCGGAHEFLARCCGNGTP